MIDNFSNRESHSEREMQTLFAQYLPVEPLPPAFAAQLKERVLAEVALVIKPAHPSISGPVIFFQQAISPKRTPLAHRAIKLVLIFAFLTLLIMLFFSQWGS
jgi:hypothetical protein